MAFAPFFEQASSCQATQSEHSSFEQSVVIPRLQMESERLHTIAKLKLLAKILGIEPVMSEVKPDGLQGEVLEFLFRQVQEKANSINISESFDLLLGF